ncbi:MAG: septal ring lytic transglycosylase RlpA family protein [Bacteroidota bacterium]
MGARRRGLLPGVLVLTLALIQGCAGPSPRFTSRSAPPPPAAPSPTGQHQLAGVASYYADEFHLRPTASGEKYDMHELTAAHRTLPFQTRVKVTNLQNNLSVVVRINDRGPFKDDRVIDLSLEAAKRIALIPTGTAPVSLEVLDQPPPP